MNVTNLRVHPAQMRTRISAAELARLVKQVIAGFDASLPLLVMDNGTVISGHRRWLAAMIGYLTPDDQVEQTIADLCQPDKDGWIALTEALYEQLVNQVGELHLPVQVWEGQYEIMTLIRANMGPEAPDLLGQARCFKAGLAQGLSLEQLAEASGLNQSLVGIMSLIPMLPRFWQGLLQKGILDLEVVPGLLKTEKFQLSGMAHALKQYQSDIISRQNRPMPNLTSQISLALIRAQEGPPRVDRSKYLPSAVNVWEVVNQLWHKARLASSLYEQLTMRIIMGHLDTTSANHWQHMLSEVAGLESYFLQGYLKPDTLKEFIPEADCLTCHFSQLPEEKLRYELEPACREGQPGPCWYWAPKDEPFYYRLPWTWIEGSGREVHSISELIKAWDQERKAEMARPVKPAIAGLSAGEDTRPIEAQREAIRRFMSTHDKAPFAADHPWATACVKCRYHLEASPVQSDPEAPHCQWAKLLQRLKFEARIPKEENLGTIPFCFQFRPVKPWSEILPDGGQPAFPREVLYPVIERLGEQTNRDVYDCTCRGVVQFLTGRPEKASGNHRQHFTAVFRKERDALSDGQLWTLFQWVMLEWLRVQQHNSFGLVPYPGGLIECGLHHYNWAFDDEEVDSGQGK